MTPQELAQAKNLAEYLKAFIRRIEEAAFSVAYSGKEVPSFKLVRKNGWRKYSAKPKEVIDFARRFAQFTDEELFDRELIGPSPLEKALRAKLKAQGLNVKEVKAVIDQLEFLISRPGSDKLELVSASDEREAIDPRKFLGLDQLKAV